LVIWNSNPLAIRGPTGWPLEQLGRVPEGTDDEIRLATANEFIEKFHPRMTVVSGVPVYIKEN